MKEKSIKGLSGKVYYTDTGEGHAIIMLHGFLESREMWLDLSTMLSAHFRCILIDLPGHGKSVTQSKILGMDLMAEVIDQVVSNERLDPIILLGHSMGGYVALEYVRKFSEKVKGLILMHSHAAADEPATRQNRDRAIQTLAKSKRYFIRSFFPDLFHAPDKHMEVIESSATIAERMPVDQIIAVMKGMRDRKDSIQLLESIPFPVLFIGGEFDPRIPVSMIRSQSILPKGSELIILPNAAHMGHIEDFLLLSERILEFLNKLIATE